MKKFKVTTRWIGYSEIEIEAESAEDAADRAMISEYDPDNEKRSLYDNESVIKVEAV